MFKKIQGGQQALLAVSGQLPILSEEQVHNGVEWSVQCLISETLAHFMLHHMPNLNRAVLSSSFAIMLSPPVCQHHRMHKAKQHCVQKQIIQYPEI